MERAIFAQNVVQFPSSINSKFHVDETDDSHIPANVLENEYFPGTFLAAMMLLKSPSVPQQYSNTCFAWVNLLMIKPQSKIYSIGLKLILSDRILWKPSEFRSSTASRSTASILQTIYVPILHNAV